MEDREICPEEVELSVDSSLKFFKRHLLHRVRPNWNEKELDGKKFTAGHTNELVAIFLKEKGLEKSREEVVLLRRNGEGSEKLVNRVDEFEFMQTMHKVGLGCRVYQRLKNGMCYGYSPGRQVGFDEVREEKMGKKIAEVLAALHTTTIPEHFQNREPQVWAKVDKWIKEVPLQFKDPHEQKRFQEGVGSIAAFGKEIDWLKTQTKSTKFAIVFCHNDLVMANIVFDERTGKVHLLDFEYGGPNFLAFDIADHFCAFAGAGKEMNYDFYPDKDFQKKWLYHYLKKRIGIMAANEDELEEKVEALYEEVNIFAMASLLFWSLWGLIQAHYSLIPFNYILYASVKFKEYLRRKAILTSGGKSCENPGGRKRKQGTMPQESTKKRKFDKTKKS